MKKWYLMHDIGEVERDAMELSNDELAGYLYGNDGGGKCAGVFATEEEALAALAKCKNSRQKMHHIVTTERVEYWWTEKHEMTEDGLAYTPMDDDFMEDPEPVFCERWA